MPFRNAYLQAVRARREAEQQDGICVKQRQHGTHWKTDDILKKASKHNLQQGQTASQRHGEQEFLPLRLQHRPHAPCGIVPRTLADLGVGEDGSLVAQSCGHECDTPSVDSLGEQELSLARRHACLAGHGRIEGGAEDLYAGGGGAMVDWSVATPIQRAACALNMKVDDLLVLLVQQQERGTKLPTNVRFALSREALDLVLRDLHR